MWMFVTVLLVAAMAEISRMRDEKVSVEEEESDELDSEEEDQYEDDDQEFEVNGKDNLTDENVNLEKQSGSHPPGKI